MNSETSKFTTGLLIDYFDELPQELFDMVITSKERGTISEALVIVLPHDRATNEFQQSWTERINIIEGHKQLLGVTQFDVWHMTPLEDETNEAYVERTLLELKHQYSHQAQIIIHNTLNGQRGSTSWSSEE